MKLYVLIALYAALFAMAPVLSTRTLEVGGVQILAGMLAMVASFGVLDVIHEAYGRTIARQTVLVAAAVRAVCWALTTLVVLLPGTGGEGLGEGVRFFVAGEVAQFVSQYLVDVPIFAWLRERLKLGFWARYNLSNLTGQIISLCLFVPLALLGTGRPLLPVLVGGLLLRLAVNVLLTPAFAVLARWAAVAATLCLLVTPAQAEVHARARMLLGTGLYPARAEIIPVLKLDPVWVIEHATWNRAGIVAPGRDQNVLRSKTTGGVSVLGPASLVVQETWETHEHHELRGGLGVRLSSRALPWLGCDWMGWGLLGTRDGYLARLDTQVLLRAFGDRIWLHEILVLDAGSAGRRLTNSATLGVSPGDTWSIIVQRQDVTNVPAAWRGGLEGRF